MFTSEGSVATDEHGVEVSVTPRDWVEYRMGDHVLHIPCERMADETGYPTGEMVYFSLITNWEKPHEDEAISQETLWKVRSDLIEAFRALNFGLELA
jgi:hypothetical protein